jgi:hypothetical protein
LWIRDGCALKPRVAKQLRRNHHHCACHDCVWRLPCQFSEGTGGKKSLNGKKGNEYAAKVIHYVVDTVMVAYMHHIESGDVRQYYKPCYFFSHHHNQH